MARWSEGGWKTSWWKGWKKRVCNREEWKKLMRTARNHHILHMPMEWMKLKCVCITCIQGKELLMHSVRYATLSLLKCSDSRYSRFFVSTNCSGVNGLSTVSFGTQEKLWIASHWAIELWLREKADVRTALWLHVKNVIIIVEWIKKGSSKHMQTTHTIIVMLQEHGVWICIQRGFLRFKLT